MRTKEEWTALFEKLDVQDAEQWASCEVNEDLGNLPAAAFLKLAWADVPRSGDGGWVDTWISCARLTPGESKIVEAYDRLAYGRDIDSDLATLLRGVMGQFLHQISYILDDNCHSDEELKEAASWGLYQESDVDEPIRRIGCVHELVFDMDPESNGN